MTPKINLRSTMKDMERGDMLVVSMSQFTENTIDNYASKLGRVLGCRFSVRRNRLDNTCTIIRYE